MNGKWMDILKATDQADLGTALVQLARHAADRHLASIDSPNSGEAGDAMQAAPAQLPAHWRRLMQEARS
jgi:hypothetical protein